MRWLAGLTGLAILVAPQVANAGDAACVWRALPEDARAQSLKNYADKGPENPFDGVREEVLGEAVIACVALPRNERAAARVAETVGVALAAHVMQLGSEASLKKAYGIEPTALERAYGAIDRKRRLEFGTKIMAERTPSEATVIALMQAITVAYPAADFEALNKDAGVELFLIYFGARAIREQAEAKF